MNTEPKKSITEDVPDSTMFSNGMTFGEVWKRHQDIERKTAELKERGALLNGDRPIDKELITLTENEIAFTLNLKEEEIIAIFMRAQEELEQPE